MTVSHLKLNLTNMAATSSLTVFCNLKDPALPQNLLYLHHTQGISNHPEVPQRVFKGRFLRQDHLQPDHKSSHILHIYTSS